MFHTQTHRILLPTAILAMLAISRLGAQTPTADELRSLREQIAALEARLAEVEAQTAQPPAVKPAEDATTVSTDRRGLVVTSPDKSFTFRIRPRIQIDGHFFTGDGDGNDEVVLRRLRPVFEGNAGPAYFRFMPEFATSTKVLDAWIDLNLTDDLYVRAGKFKGVIGLERLQSFSKGLFAERGLPSILTPTRETGVAIFQSLFDNRVEVTVGAYGGVFDESDGTTNRDLSGDFDFGARVFVTPWINEKGSPLKGLGFGFAASTGDENTSLDGSDDRRLRYRSSGRNTFQQVQNGVLVSGSRVRLNPHLYYYNGPFGFLTEYVSSSYTLSRGGVEHDISTAAWTVQAGWVLTGEGASFNGVRPKDPFNPGKSGWGAFEVGARYGKFNGDEDLFTDTASTVLATASSAQDASSYGVALNWYLTDNLLWAFNYEITDFSGAGADRPSENVLISRFQIDF